MNPILSLDKEAQDIVNNIANAGKGLAKTTSIAIARAIAYHVPIDIIELEDFTSLWVSHRITNESERLTSIINEIVVVDIDTIIALTRSFYMFRVEHTLAIPSIALNPGKGVADFFKISKYFDDATLEVINNEPLEITRLTNAVAKILDQLSSCKEGGC